MRNLGLDLLRLLAVVLVLGRHLNLPKNPSPLLIAWNRGGWVGVDLFFVLSGFLISGLLFTDTAALGS
jgi:peptidoglycan/LPS O-acetylase OafA/YrhL